MIYIHTESDGAWCGNQIQEDDEECDCGYTADCIGDNCCPCCHGQNDQNNFAQACKLRTDPGMLKHVKIDKTSLRL